jgi:NAD(P)-dependent dehydrogenase (short-subunit alcohol dehydrogenase family)
VLGDKVTLITGAGQGIGRAIAVEAARQGAPGVAVADLNADAAEETAEQVRSTGAAAQAIACDLRNADEIRAMVNRAVSAFERLDVLVNNAGVIETSMTADCAVDTLPEEVSPRRLARDQVCRPSPSALLARRQHRQRGVGVGADGVPQGTDLLCEQRGRRPADESDSGRSCADDPV